MSLVAYNSSDESGQSDAEDEAKTEASQNMHPTLVPDGQISDEEEDLKTALNASERVVSSSVNTGEPENGSVSSLLKGLPTPQAGVEEGINEEEGMNGEDELEEEVKPKVTQMQDAPKPPTKKGKQPVKISIPKLEDDPEESEPALKKHKTSENKGKSGLFALLPAPVHVAKKEANRILIPHTLSKRVQEKKQATKTVAEKPDSSTQKTDTQEDGFSKRYTAFSGLTGYDSDSDEEGRPSSNFFSLDSENTGVNSESPGTENTGDCTVTSSENQVNPKPVKTVSYSAETVLPAVVSHIPSQDSSEVQEAESEEADVAEPADQDAPLSFKPLTNSYNPLSAASMSSRYQYMQPQQTVSYGVEPYPSQEQYTEYTDEMEQEDVSKYMQDEQFLRLQGKNRRGKEEINIIDANMDDFVNTVDVTKNLTEESSNQSHRKKDNNPTQQQRRKKQITYLAYQAKEKELELKNSWAANRMTKRQTQAKYGF